MNSHMYTIDRCLFVIDKSKYWDHNKIQNHILVDECNDQNICPTVEFVIGKGRYYSNTDKNYRRSMCNQQDKEQQCKQPMR